MKKPKRASVLLLWCIAIFFAISGCSASQTKKQEALQPIEKTITITFTYGSKAFTKTIPYGSSVEVEVPPPENGKVFAGWFCGQEKLTDSAQFTADKNFVAVFIERGDYKGIFRSDELLLTVYFSEGDGIGIDNAFYSESQLFVNQSGELELMYSGGEWAFFLLNGALTATHTTEKGKTSHTFKPITRNAEYAGAYRTNGSESFVLSEYGTVLFCLGEVSGGVYTVVDGVLTLTFRRSGSDFAFTTMIFKADGNGNFIGAFTGKTELYVLSEGVKTYTAENGDKLNVFLRGEDYVYTLIRRSTQMVDAEGEPNEGNVLVLSGAANTAIKLLEGNKFVYASGERGNYVSVVGDRLILDGFGTATVRGYEWAYEVVGNNVIAMGGGQLPNYIRLNVDGKYEHIDFNLHAFEGRWTGKTVENLLTVNVNDVTVTYRGFTAEFKANPSESALVFTANNTKYSLQLDGSKLTLTYTDDSGEKVTEQYGTDGYEGKYLSPSMELNLDGLGIANLDGKILKYETNENTIVFNNGITGEFNGDCLIMSLPDEWIMILNKA